MVYIPQSTRMTLPGFFVSRRSSASRRLLDRQCSNSMRFSWIVASIPLM
jgi:hypothetical protein